MNWLSPIILREEPIMKKASNKAPALTLLIIAFLLLAVYIFLPDIELPNSGSGQLLHQLSPVEKIDPSDRAAADLILLGARQEVRNMTRYDASYQIIDYPQGDVDADQGACTDTVIRAFRNAGIDLQQLIHEDMADNFGLYPDNWGLTAPDTNIDHRRVPNQMQFFKRFGQELTVKTTESNQWQWGDVVYWRFANGDEHCGIISDKTTMSGWPLVIHNAGITREEDCLKRWEIIGHYRYPLN